MASQGSGTTRLPHVFGQHHPHVTPAQPIQTQTQTPAASFHPPVRNLNEHGSLPSLPSLPSSSTVVGQGKGAGQRIAPGTALGPGTGTTTRRLVLHTPPPLPPPPPPKSKANVNARPGQLTPRSRSSSLPLLQTSQLLTQTTPDPETESMGLGQSKQLPPTPHTAYNPYTLTPSQLENQSHDRDREQRREGNKLRRAFGVHARRKESLNPSGNQTLGRRSEDGIALGVLKTGYPTSHLQVHGMSNPMNTRNGHATGPASQALQVPVVPPKQTRSLPNPTLGTELPLNGSGSAAVTSSPPFKMAPTTTTTSNALQKTLPSAPSQPQPQQRQVDTLGAPLASASASTPYLAPPPLSLSPSPSKSKTSKPKTNLPQLSLLSTTTITTSAAPLPTTAISTISNSSTGTNRTSVIPLSPGISQAVNYMMLQSPVGSPVEGPNESGVGKDEVKGSSSSAPTSVETQATMPIQVAGQNHQRQHPEEQAEQRERVRQEDSDLGGNSDDRQVDRSDREPSAAEVSLLSASSLSSSPATSSASSASQVQASSEQASADADIESSTKGDIKDGVIGSSRVDATESPSLRVGDPTPNGEVDMNSGSNNLNSEKDSNNPATSIAITNPAVEASAPAGAAASSYIDTSVTPAVPQPVDSTSMPASCAPSSTSTSMSSSPPPAPKRLSGPSSPFSSPYSSSPSNHPRPRPLSVCTTSTARAHSGLNSADVSRPVSWAESFQSVSTVVPGDEATSSVGVDKRKRMSVSVLTGVEGWLEEDEEYEEVGEEEDKWVTAPSTVVPPPASQGPTTLSTTLPQTAPLTQPLKETEGRSPLSSENRPQNQTSSKLRNRRSMSLSSVGVLSGFGRSASPISTPITSTSGVGLLKGLEPRHQVSQLRPFEGMKTGDKEDEQERQREGEEKPQVPPKPTNKKRYDHVRAPSIGSSISVPSTNSNSGAGTGGAGGVYAHGKSSSHSNLLGLSNANGGVKGSSKAASPPSTINNVGLRGRFAAWTGLSGAGLSGDEGGGGGTPGRKQSSASVSSMSMASGTGSGSASSFSSNSVPLSSSPSSFGSPGPGPHSHLGHSQQQGPIHTHSHHHLHAQGQGQGHRIPTGSVSGLGPAAAGLAKRAVEKMGRKWGARIGFSVGMSNSSGSVGQGATGDEGVEANLNEGRPQHKQKHKRTPNAKSGGWLPGASGLGMFSSGPSGLVGGQGGNEGAGDGAGSSISSSIASLSPSAGGSTCATSMSGVSLGMGCVTDKGHSIMNPNATHNAGAGANPGSSNSGDPFSPSGPNLGRLLCGPLKAKGGVVFGRDLKAAVVDSRCVTWEEHEDGDESSDDEAEDCEGYEEGEGDVSWSWSEDEASGIAADGGRGRRDEKDAQDDENSFLRVKKTIKDKNTSRSRSSDGRSKRRRRKEGLVKRLENREVPAVVVRCAQHVLIWGVKEEGLFRVPGRPRHVNILRQEFDTGADWDMTECSPGDLDPHAVASVFKAYLRELPEPIMTHKLQPYFDAAITKENSMHEQAQLVAQQSTIKAQAQAGQGLPSNPKSGHIPPGLRKPLSLSTLAMPTFSGLPPPSRSLINAIRSLISQLPAENRDLIRTVVDLIKVTARESKETKMPLSNLMLVFCPSLNMSPPLLKVLCEAPGIWPEEMEEGIVLDIRRNSGRKQEDDDGPPPTPAKDEDHARAPTVYLDTMSHLSSSSVASLQNQQDSPVPSSPPPSAYNYRQRSKDNESISSIPFSFSGSRNAVRTPSTPLSSEAESVVTPTSSANPSFASLPLTGKRKNSNASISLLSKQSSSQQLSTPQIVEPPSSPSPNDRKRPMISNPIPITGPVQFPTDGNSAQPQGPRKREGLSSQSPTKRRSIPLLSLSGFSTSSGKEGKEGSANASPRSGNNSPGIMPIADGDGPPKEPRMKKPSLKLLFSKKSSSSLTMDKGSTAVDANPSNPYGGLGLSVPNPPFFGSDRYASSERGGSPRTASDSSISTPLSAVTAPQGNSWPGSVLSIPMGMSKSNSYSSTKEKDLPPVLDTPIEEGSLAIQGMGSVLTPSTATTATIAGLEVASPSSETTASAKSPTPKAEMFPQPPSLTSVATHQPTPDDSLPSVVLDVPPSSPTAGRRSVEQTARLRSLRGKHHRPASTGTSGMPSLNGSTMSLSLDGLGEDGEDWTSSVLLAADEAFGDAA